MLNQRSLIISVALRISFVRLPDVESERVFRDTLVITDTERHNLDDLESVIEKKIAFMEYPPCDFTIFFNDPSGDRIVVDHSYYYKMLSQWSKLEPKHEALIGESQCSLLGNESSGVIEASLAVEVEIKRIKPFLSGSTTGGTETIAPLTLENLNKIQKNNITSAEVSAPLGISVPVETAVQAPSNTSGVSVPIKLLKCPPPQSGFFVKGVITAIRMKTVKTGTEVVEVDLCDMLDPESQITAVSFDSAVLKAIKENLRADRRQVVELHRVYLRRKNETDIRFQSNSHPLLIRLDRHSRIEVVQILSIPVPRKNVESVVTVRRNMSSGGFVDVGDLVSGTDAIQKRSLTYTSSASENSSLQSSSGTTGPRRTTFSIQLSNSLSETHRTHPRKVSEGPLLEPGVVHTTKRDVYSRENAIAEFSSREEERKERIRMRKEASSQCILCGLDLGDETTSMSIVRRLLEANRCNKGIHIPSLQELISALSDKRMNRRNQSPGRLLSNATFVNLDTRTVHRVHCRCAHLCTSYQQGKSIEDIVSCDLACNICSLCGLAGAIVSCYHPDCTEQYHAICALYSKGYVNFGKKDPYMPCPACPRHTQVVVSVDPNEIPVLHEDISCWDDNVVFDSRVVESTDLRDPDENGGL